MTITQITTKYIREHPSIADCLDRGLINYSALAREICQKLNIDSFEAVLVACRRYHAKQRSRATHEKRIATLIRRAKIRIRTKISVAIVDKARTPEKILGIQKVIREQRGDLNLIEGEQVYTIVTNDEFSSLIKEAFEGRIRKITKGLVQITMVFDETLESVSGVLATVYRLLAANDVNIREEMSCWTDIMMLIDEKDLTKATHVLGSYDD